MFLRYKDNFAAMPKNLIISYKKSGGNMRVLLTGGAGFVGSNLASRLAMEGMDVVILDNLSRRGTERNISWLLEKHPGVIEFMEGDIRDRRVCGEASRDAAVIFHLAGQVAVTTSVVKPRDDFEVNAIGTFNMLEAARESSARPVFLFSSTNKVYGGMEDLEVIEEKKRYRFADYPDGVGEERPLDFHSPYGCSKGCADQYVRDYSRIYGMRTVVFRMSCIYGPRQFGNEDQGWVAHFMISGLKGNPVTIYGDGKQVRDILFVDDLLDAYLEGVKRVDEISGEIFNVGGGPDNTLSLLELISFMEELYGRKVKHSFSDWRPGDQPVYVSDIRKLRRRLGWKPRLSVRDGIKKLHNWIAENEGLFA